MRWLWRRNINSLRLLLTYLARRACEKDFHDEEMVFLSLEVFMWVCVCSVP